MKSLKHWLMKSEPESYSVDDFARDKKSMWDGVRNYQARNLMMNDMSVGDPILFYHSNADITGIAGVGKVSKKAFPDPSALDKKSKYHDPKATKEKPIWYCVEVEFVKKLPRIVTLAEVKEHPKLQNMMLIRRGMRLSIQPVEKTEFDLICKLSEL